MKKSKARFLAALVQIVPNVILTKEDRKEIEESSARIKKVKVSKKSYFEGFKEAK